MWAYLFEAWRVLLAAAIVFTIGLLIIWAPRDLTAVYPPTRKEVPERTALAPATAENPACAAKGTNGIEAKAPIPLSPVGQWFTTDDYPEDALRNDEQGTVAVKYRIGPTGLIDACEVTMSSGSKSLDEASCRVLRKRGWFEPAKDANDCPIASYGTRRIRWQLPEDGLFVR